jgi:hypothetical protein
MNKARDLYVKLAFGESHTSNRVRNREMSFNELAVLLSQPGIGPKGGEYLLRGPCKENERKDKNLTQATLLVSEADDGLDLRTGEVIDDHAPDPLLIHEYLKEHDYTHVIYTSHSSEVDGNGYKYRIIIKPERPMNPLESKATIIDLFNRLNEAGIGIYNAPENVKWSQPWFLPKVQSEELKRNFKFYSHEGKSIPVVTEIPSASAAGAKAKGQRKDNEDGLDPIRALQLAVNGDFIAVVSEFNKQGVPEAYAELLERHGYKPEGSNRWRKPDSSHSAGVSIYQGESDGAWLLSSHHENDPLHEPEGKPIDYFETYARLEFGHIEEARRKREARDGARKILLDVLRARTAGMGRASKNPADQVSPFIPILTPLEARMKLAYIEACDGVLHIELDRMPVPMKTARNKFAASSYTADVQGKQKTMPVLDLWIQDPDRLSYEVTGFQPGGGRDIESPDGRRAINLWKPIHREGIVDQVKIQFLIDHIQWLFGDRADNFLNWVAHIEQQPGILPHVAWLHIAPYTGLGRNWIAGVLARVFCGYVAAGLNLVQMLSDGFTDDLSQRLLAQVDEIREGGKERWEHSETLKSYFNAEFRIINRKGIPAYRERNFCRWLLFSNHIDAVPIQDNDRRVEVVICHESPKSEEYYIQLYSMLDDPDFINSVGLWLRQRDITGFNPGSPAKLSADKALVLRGQKSEEALTIEDLIETYPSDVISNTRLAQKLDPYSLSQSLKPNQNGLLKRYGLIAAQVRADGKPIRVKILRNPLKWAGPDVTPDELRAELQRGEVAVKDHEESTVDATGKVDLFDLESADLD